MSVVLVIDDNEAVRTSLEMLLALHRIPVRLAATPQAGLAQLAEHEVDIVIQDMNFSADTTSGQEGIELFGAIRARDPEMPVILLTAWTHLSQAVELVKAGASDYLEKPWSDDKLVTAVKNLIQLRHATRENGRLRAEREARRESLARRFDLRGLVYESDAMHEVVSLGTQVAHADVPVLLSGPNGSGKERLADIVQAASACADGPYLKVNVGALPGQLLESELFGAEAGAYTGADRTRPGRFEAADGGTLFLDEIGELDPGGQVKLLRVLQTGEFQRLGSSVTRRARVRILSATNRDLRAAVADGSFREDLYYRLNVIELRIPGLSERPDDILPLARCFLGDERELEPAAAQALLDHPWPGNVRELENCIQRAMLLAPERAISPQHLGLEAATPAAPPARAPGPEPTREAILEALEQAGGVVAHASRALGMSRQALYRRMDKFGIDRA